MLDWTELENYQFTHDLSREEWAWEFLRRNKTYQQQWQDFMQVWMALEEKYGKAPNRNFSAWKLDERAWIPAAHCSESDCRVDQDKVLIECAMGARWGFYKFPPDPADSKAVAENRLTWRETSNSPETRELSTADTDYLGQQSHKLALGFDLSLPLKQQLQDAKRYLQLAQRQRVRQKLFELQNLQNLREHLTLCLRLVDARQSGATPDVIQTELSPADIEQLASDSEHLINKGYLELLQLPA